MISRLVRQYCLIAFPLTAKMCSKSSINLDSFAYSRGTCPSFSHAMVLSACSPFLLHSLPNREKEELQLLQ